MTEHTTPSATLPYVYRRDLRPVELLPALGIAVGVGAIAFYVARVLTERTALDTGDHRGSRRPYVPERRDRER